MEPATRYFQTIENLMVEVSRLKKELADALKGKMPSRIVPQDEADRCFGKISEIIGPVAKGSLISEVTALCEEFKVLAAEYTSAVSKLAALTKEQKAIESIVKGNDINENDYVTATTKNVARLRAVLEVAKMRLDRIDSSNSSIAEIKKDIAHFLSNESTNG